MNFIAERMVLKFSLVTCQIGEMFGKYSDRDSGLGYDHYWRAAALNRLSDMLRGGFGLEPPFRIVVSGCGEKTFAKRISAKLLRLLKEHEEIVGIVYQY